MSNSTPPPSFPPDDSKDKSTPSTSPQNPHDADSEMEKKQEWKKEEVKKDALRVIKKIPLVLVVAYLVFQTYIATSEYTEGVIEDRYAMEDSLEFYQEKIKAGIELRNSQIDVDPNTLGVTEVFDENGTLVTTGNFEGPQLFIEGLEFGDEVIDLQKHPGMLDFSVTSLLFDPDHSKMGLPDLDVRVSPIKLYEPDKGNLGGILGNIKRLLPGKNTDDKPKPYSVYTKEIQLSDGTLRKIAMQLWLTEFKVTIGAKPDILKNAEIKKVKKALDEKLKEPPERNDSIQKKINAANRNIEEQRNTITRIEKRKSLTQKQIKDQNKLWKKLSNEIKKNQRRLIRNATSKRLARKEELAARESELGAVMKSLENTFKTQNDSINQRNERLDSLHSTLLAYNEELRQYQMKDSPESWYNHTGIRGVTQADLGKDRDKENQNQIYDNIKVWFKVMPNASPWYVKNKDAENLKPKMAIGAIYCTEVNNDVLGDNNYKLDPNQPQQNASVGMAMALYDKMNFKNPMHRNGQFQNLAPLLNSNTYLNEPANPASIWDKPYYMKLFLKNVGSHKKSFAVGKNKLKEYDDQFTFTFLMPLLVRGSWDVIPPNEVIPEWMPPEPRTVKGFQFSHLLPSWGFSIFGKTASFIILILGVLFVLNFFFPGLREVIVFISNLFFDTVKSVINWVKSIIPKKKA